MVGMGEKDELLYVLYPGNYTTTLGWPLQDQDSESPERDQKIKDWEELLNAVQHSDHCIVLLQLFPALFFACVGAHSMQHY